MVIAALSQVLPTDCGVDEHVDWAAAEAKWGSGFPPDFMAFMSVYGAGSLTRDIEILQPLSPDFEEETETARYTWEMEGGREALNVDPSHILAWGATGGGDILGWLTTHADPEAWPVLVWERGSAEFRIHACGMTEFLRKLLLDEFPTYPINIDLRSADWRFVHWSVARDRRRAGLDTHTGLPQ